MSFLAGDTSEANNGIGTRPLSTVVADGLDAVVFYSLLLTMALIAIPYGATEPWWKGVFQSFVFLLAAIAVVESWLRNTETRAVSFSAFRRSSGALLLPLLALLIFAFVQTVPWSRTVAGVERVQWTLSRDPYQTKLFMIQVGALVSFGWMLVRHTHNARRLYFVIDTIIAIAVASAVFGLWRQASQQHVGFLLPYLRPGFGYGQFINSNHFAFMMEMALGLTLGIAIMRGVKGRRLAVYLIAAALMWLAVIRVNSRGGLLSMLCQVVILGVLLVARRTKKELVESGRTSPIKQRVLQVILVVMLLIGSVVTVIFVGGDPLATRIDSLSVELNQKTAQTYALRQNIWQATWALIKDHPIGGAGFGGYWMAIRKYHRASGETTPQQAHNDYLELLASGGVIALGIGIWFVVVFVKLARTALNNADELGTAVITGASIGIVTVLVHSLVDFGLHVTVNALVFTTLIALVAIVERRGRKPLQT